MDGEPPADPSGYAAPRWPAPPAGFLVAGRTVVDRTQMSRSLPVPIATRLACPARWCSPGLGVGAGGALLIGGRRRRGDGPGPVGDDAAWRAGRMTRWRSTLWPLRSRWVSRSKPTSPSPPTGRGRQATRLMRVTLFN